MNVLVVSNGNEPQAPFALRLFETLRDNAGSDVKLDVLFMSDFLHEPTTAIFQEHGVEVVIFSPSKVNKWEKLIGSNQHALGKVGKPFFIRELMENHVDCDRYNCICYCDPDIIFQGDIGEIIRGRSLERVFISRQLLDSEKSIGPARKMDRAVAEGLAEPFELNNFDREINTGLFGGSPAVLLALLREWTSFMVDSRFTPLKDGEDMPDAWHDQDFFRMYLRSGDGKRLIEPLDMASCATLCSGAPTFYDVELDRIRVTTKDGNEKPSAVHFAGASWRMYPILRPYYDYSNRYPTLHKLEPAPNYFRKKAEELELELTAAKQETVRVAAMENVYRRWTLAGAIFLGATVLLLFAKILLF
jgi:hypothetical protein